MDPTELLKELLHALARWKDATAHTQQRRQLEAAGELAERLEDLHEWMARGGFKPRQWSRFDGPEPQLDPDECGCKHIQCTICKSTWTISE